MNGPEPAVTPSDGRTAGVIRVIRVIRECVTLYQTRRERRGGGLYHTKYSTAHEGSSAVQSEQNHRRNETAIRRNDHSAGKKPQRRNGARDFVSIDGKCDD